MTIFAQFKYSTRIFSIAIIVARNVKSRFKACILDLNLRDTIVVHVKGNKMIAPRATSFWE